MIVDSCLNKNRRPVALDYFNTLKVNVGASVKLLVASHWHDDHIRGLGDVYAAASSAEVVASAAFRAKEFFLLVGAMQENSFMDTTGVHEWTRVLRLVGERRGKEPLCHVTYAMPERLLFKREANPANNIASCEIWSLSPSDENFQKSVAAFSKLFPKKGSPKKRLVAPSPNNTSVVLWINCGGYSVLLGADLEQDPSPNCGWNVIVESTKRPGKAGIFKVPHHGSSNGHNEKVWKNLLIDNPVAITSPFVHGDVRLPTANDIGRLKGLSRKCYITADPLAPKDKRRGHGAVGKTIADVVKRIRDVPAATGHIRLRAKPADTWRVDLFGTAYEL